jgi:hypothetical protein
MGNLESIDRVKKELSEGDELEDWKKEASGFFVPSDSANVVSTYGDIIQWVYSQDRFTDAAKSNFADDVDPWVIAYAKANNFLVVTHEVSAPKSRKEVKIPDVCNQFNVQWTNTFDMLQKLGITFYWKAS